MFITLKSTHYVRGQEDSKWLMFKQDSFVENPFFGLNRKYCSFLKIEQDTNRFTLYEYYMFQNKKGKIIYSKFYYNGHYVFTEDSSALDLKPGGVKIVSRSDGQVIKEEKTNSENFLLTLSLSPYRLIHYNREVESLFNANPFYFSMLVCQMLDNDRFKKFDSAFAKWGHSQFEYPTIDSTLLVDTNKYFLEIPDLSLDEVLQVELYFYQKKESVEILKLDYTEERDSLITITTKPKSNHVLVHKHYLMLRNNGYAVRFKKE